jgi:hypothetical protein
MTKSEFLSDMVRINGYVKASLLVEAARDEENPFHSAFEWDEGTAAHEFRLHQARRIIRVVLVRVEDSPKQQALIHVTVANKNEGEYHPRNVVMRCPSKHARAYAEVIRLHRAIGVLLEQLGGSADD